MDLYLVKLLTQWGEISKPLESINNTLNINEVNLKINKKSKNRLYLGSGHSYELGKTRVIATIEMLKLKIDCIKERYYFYMIVDSALNPSEPEFNDNDMIVDSPLNPSDSKFSDNEEQNYNERS